MAHSTCVGSRAVRGPRQGCEVSSLGGRGRGARSMKQSPLEGCPEAADRVLEWRMTMGSSRDRDSNLPAREEYPHPRKNEGQNR